jgi:PAS domain S-box-containing protein
MKSSANPIKDDHRTKAQLMEELARLRKYIAGLEEMEIEHMQVQAKLEESHERLLSVLDSIDAAVYVADTQTYEILFANKYILDTFGNVVGKTCWQTLQADQTNPCSFCTNKKLVSPEGEPTGVHRWEFRNTVNGRWHEIHDRAIKWVDGRLVRLEIATDITGRKRAEEALKESDKRYRDLVTNALVGMYQSNLKGDILYINDATLKIFEFDSPEEMMSGGVQKLYNNPEEREVFIDTLKKKGQLLGYELEMRTKSGKTKNVLASAALEGDVITGMCFDITEHKRTEEALRHSEEKHRSLFANASDAIYLTEPLTQRILDCNKKASEMDGYSIEELKNMTIDELHPDDELKLFAEKFKDVLEKGSMSNISGLHHVRKDGRAVPIEANATMINVGGKLMNLSVVRDVTERKKREEALRAAIEKTEEEKAKSEAIVAGIGDGITIVDTDYRILYQNQIQKDMMGDQVGDYCYKGYVKRDSVCEDCAVARCFKDGKIHREEKVAVLDSEKGRQYVEITASPLRDGTGKIVGGIEVVRDITERRRSEDKIQRHFEHLKAMRTIDMAITSSLDLRLTLNVFLEQVTTQLRVDAADVLLLNPHTMLLEYAAGRGFRTFAIKDSALRLDECYGGRAALERRPMAINDFSKTPEGFMRTSMVDEEEFRSYVGVPLVVKGQVKGVLEVFHRSLLGTEPEWMELLDSLTKHAAVAIDNAVMFDALQHSHDELIMAYDTTIEGWSRALDYRDRETKGHSQRVMEITLQIAREMGMGDAELVHVRRGALLHDIGKLGVPDEILFKPGSLSEEEWSIMRRHPVVANELISPIPFLRKALDIPYYHHEKWDGSGYPMGLKGEQIPLTARIFAVVDVWDALNSDRPYRQAWPREEALEHIRSQAGKHFDPRVAEVFLGMDL